MNAYRRRVAGEAFAVGAPTAAVAVLAIRGLAARSMWEDEGVSAYVVSGSIDRLGWWFREEPTFALYYGLLRGWSMLGTSDFQLRLLSLLFAVLTVPVMYAVGRRLFGVRIAAIAVAVLSVNGLFLGYAQEARPYSLAVLTSTLATLFVVRAIDEPEQMRRWTIWVIAATAAALAHPFCVLVVLAHLVVLLARRRELPVRDIVLTAALPAGVLGALAVRQLRFALVAIDWIPSTSPGRVQRVAHMLTGSAHGSAPLAGYLCALAVVGFHLLRRGERRRSITTEVSFAVCWLVTPIVSAVLISFFQPVLLARYLIVAIPPLVLLVGVGVGQLRTVAAATATAALVAVSIPTAMAPIRDAAAQDWRGAVVLLESSAQPGDVIILPSMKTMEMTVRYYVERSDVRASILWLSVPGVSSGGRDAVNRCRVDAVWTMSSGAVTDDVVRAKLADTHERVRTVHLEGVVVRRFERRAGVTCAV